jgi:hypothetical protein
MSDTTNPAEKPVNDGGGGNLPQADSEPTEEQVAAESQSTEGGGSD